MEKPAGSVPLPSPSQAVEATHRSTRPEVFCPAGFPAHAAAQCPGAEAALPANSSAAQGTEAGGVFPAEPSVADGGLLAERLPSLLAAAERYAPGKKRRPRKGRVFAAPERSGRIYVRIASSKVHMFRFLLEAQDNLGLMTVVDRWGAVLLVRFSPHQEREVRAFLQDMQASVPFTVLDLPLR